MLRFNPPDKRRLPLFRRRRGLRWRLSVFLIVATLVPVIVVAVVAATLVFSSVEQGIEFEAQRGLQVARALLLGEVHDRAKAAAALGNEGALLSALARTPREVRLRLAELSERQPSALLEVTDAVGRVLARCAGGTCNDAIVSERFAAFDPADRSPVVRRALEFERTISIEPAGNWLVVRAAFPLVDPALRLLGAAVVSAAIDGPVADRVKAELGAAREVIFYRGHRAERLDVHVRDRRAAARAAPACRGGAGHGPGAGAGGGAGGWEPRLLGGVRTDPGSRRTSRRVSGRGARSRDLGGRASAGHRHAAARCHQRVADRDRPRRRAGATPHAAAAEPARGGPCRSRSATWTRRSRSTVPTNWATSPRRSGS